MRRASCRAPQNSFTVNTSTEAYSDHPDLSLAAGESRPCYHKPETLHDQPPRRVLNYKTPLPNTNSPFQQVGLARVHVEILLLSDERRQSEHNGLETNDGSAGETDSEESESDDGGSGAESSNRSHETAPTTTTAAINNTAQVQTSPHANQSLSPLRRNRVQREDEDDGDDENNRPRKRPRGKPRGVDPPKQRFACPYQAYEQGRDCFKPSQRNPSGGCDNITRLKDHLKRRHMPSYRCSRCWKHFNAKDKAQAHPESNCVEKEMPSYEWFMTLEQEAQVDNCGGTQAEDTWWKLFQLLIPGMDREDLPQLKTRYYHYYVSISDYVDMSLSIPSLNLSHLFFDNTHLFSGTNGNETTPVSLASPSGAFSELGSTTITSQSFHAPIYGAAIPSLPPMPSIEDSVTDVMSLSAAPQLHELGSTTPGDTLNMSSTPASSHTMAPSLTSDASQMRRNYERLKMRASQADAENGELRETIGSTREEVRTARDLLEEVLGMDNLDGEAYERLSRVADVLGGVTRRLR